MANSGLYNKTQGSAANAIAGYFNGGKPASAPQPEETATQGKNFDGWKNQVRQAFSGVSAQPAAAAAPTTPAPPTAPGANPFSQTFKQ